MTAARAFLDNRDFERIARAIAYIDANFRTQPRLAAIAASARLSEFHFNRLFRRWAGVTPRQYLAHVTARAARGALAASPSVLDAAYAVGLSGPSRLHDLMVTLEGVTPGELKARGAGLTIRYGLTPTPFGQALLAVTPRGICHLSFVAAGCEADACAGLAREWPRARLTRDDAEAVRLAERIFGAHPTDTPLRLTVKGTNFQLRVWRALLELGGRGRTTYGELALAAGVPRASRAVGRAVGANPIAWLIPCHNVLRQDGALGGYHWGAERKRAILAWESLRPTQRRATGALASSLQRAQHAT